MFKQVVVASAFVLVRSISSEARAFRISMDIGRAKASFLSALTFNFVYTGVANSRAQGVDNMRYQNAYAQDNKETH
jgi:hypothetical protein